MKIRWLRCLSGCAVAFACLPAVAEGQAAPEALPAPASCEAPVYDGPLLLHRQERITQYEGLGEHCLKHLVMQCDAAAGRQLLDPGSAFSCSIGYEALLRRGFGGDFQAMLAWWRSHLSPAAVN